MTNKVLNVQTYLCALPYVVVKKAATRRMMIWRDIVEMLLFHWTSETFIGMLCAWLKNLSSWQRYEVAHLKLKTRFKISDIRNLQYFYL